MKFFKAIDEWFKGKMTYLFFLGFFVMIGLDIKGMIPNELLPYKLEIYFGLLGGAGIGLRRGMDNANRASEKRIMKIIEEGPKPAYSSPFTSAEKPEREQVAETPIKETKKEGDNP